MVSTSSHLGCLPSARLTQGAGAAELMTPLTPRPSSVSEAVALGRGMPVGTAAAEDAAVRRRLAEVEAFQGVAQDVFSVTLTAPGRSPVLAAGSVTCTKIFPPGRTVTVFQSRW